MSIVPLASLSASDLFMLGNNLVPARRRAARPRPRRVLSAVNRSLAAHGEAVASLHRRLVPSPPPVLPQPSHP
jgi:hypothetical protein